MSFIEASIFILFIAILCVPIASRFRIPLEIFLFVGSCIIALLAGLTTFQLDPRIVFQVFLPPILFSAAYFTSWRDFKFNLRPIIQLAVGLVIFTTLLIAVTAKWLIPELSWPEAFLLGAIVSPTDASAATAIIKKFNVPRRFVALLEGESLVNDATALTLYRFNLGVILYGSFSLPKAIGQFAITSIGAIIIGLGLAALAVQLIKRIHHTHAETTFTFILAFASYLIAEHLECSGVISTVVAGMYLGIRFPEMAASRTRLNTKATWETLIFIINGFVFTLIGLQLPAVLHNLKSYSYFDLILYGTLLSAITILIRIIWIYPTAYIPRVLFPVIQRKDPMPSHRFLFGLGWVGMRGIVSLAAALAIPQQIANTFGHIELIIFLVYFIVVTTLIIPSLTLPSIIHRLGLTDNSEENDKMKQEAIARIRIFEAITAAAKKLAVAENIPQTIYQEFVNQINRKNKVIQNQVNPLPYSLLQEDYMAYKKLIHSAIHAERQTLIDLRKIGEIQDDVFWRLSNELDLEEIRSNTLRA